MCDGAPMQYSFKLIFFPVCLNFNSPGCLLSYRSCITPSWIVNTLFECLQNLNELESQHWQDHLYS